MTDPEHPLASDLELVVPARFCGPPDSGNGGWVAGSVAALARPKAADHCRPWPSVEVTLKAPPPLEVALSGELAAPDGALTLVRGETTVAVGRPVGADPVPVAPVDADEARAAAAGFAGATHHPFPTCFVCGPDRAPDDGLRIFPGPVATDRVASTWTPVPTVVEDWHCVRESTRHASLAVTWAALDCPGAWALGIGERTMVLGRITARIDRLPVIGAEHVVVGEARGRDGRKNYAATSLYDADGLVGTTEQVWISVDRPG